MAQDQEEPVCPESTARAPAEDETQVGPLPFHWCSQAVRNLSADSGVERKEPVCDANPAEILSARVEFSVSVPD